MRAGTELRGTFRSLSLSLSPLSPTHSFSLPLSLSHTLSFSPSLSHTHALCLLLSHTLSLSSLSLSQVSRKEMVQGLFRVSLGASKEDLLKVMSSCVGPFPGEEGTT